MSQDKRNTESPIMKYFDFRHLKEGPLRDTSREFHDLAYKMEYYLPNGPEKSTALRKLLEAKDSAVRAALDKTTEDQRAPRIDEGPGPRGHEKSWKPGHGPVGVMDASTRHAGDPEMDQHPSRRGGKIEPGGGQINGGAIQIQMDEQRFGANGDAALRAMAQRAEAERRMRGNY